MRALSEGSRHLTANNLVWRALLRSIVYYVVESYTPGGFSREIMNAFSALQGPYWI